MKDTSAAALRPSVDWAALGLKSGRELEQAPDDLASVSEGDLCLRAPELRLPVGQVSEMVCPADSVGGTLVLHEAIHACRHRPQPFLVALVESGESFTPAESSAVDLEALLWVRCRRWPTQLEATDLLLRDPNFAWVILDLRAQPLRDLRQVPLTQWHRLAHQLRPGAGEGATRAPGGLLVLTTAPLVPAVARRWELADSFPLTSLNQARPELWAQLEPTLVRQRRLRTSATHLASVA